MHDGYAASCIMANGCVHEVPEVTTPCNDTLFRIVFGVQNLYEAAPGSHIKGQSKSSQRRVNPTPKRRWCPIPDKAW